MKTAIRFVLFGMLWVSIGGCASADSANALRVEVGKDAEGGWIATLENSRIRAVYRRGIAAGIVQNCIREFVIKSVNQSQGDWLDSAAHRCDLTRASVIRNEPDVKTVRLIWATKRPDRPANTAVSEVSIFRDKPWLRIDYIHADFPHICDLGAAGGTSNDTPFSGELKGTYVIYGAKEWQEARKKIKNDKLRNHPNPHHRLTNALFPLYPNPMIDEGWNDTPMNYKGWHIMGVYNRQNGRGFGRVIPVESVPYIKLLWGQGFEFFPYWMDQTWKPYTSYLFAVTGGEEEVISMGKYIVDKNTPSCTKPSTTAAVKCSP